MKENSLETHQHYRQTLFNDILSPSSRRLLRDIKLPIGAHVVDVGCGEGSLSLWLCQLVGENGRVTAIDKDETKLIRLAEKAKNQGINNLIISHGEAFEELSKIHHADMIYARFLLMHIQDPVCLLAKISQCIKENGYVVLEEPILSATNEFPVTGFWLKAMNAYRKLCDISGVKPDYGYSLIGDVKSVGLKVHFAQQVQPIIEPNLACEYLEYAIQSHEKGYLTSNILSQNAYLELLDEIRGYPIEKLDYCGFHAVMQVICCKNQNEIEINE